MRTFSKLTFMIALAISLFLFPSLLFPSSASAQEEEPTDEQSVLTIYDKMVIEEDETIRNDIISFGGELIVDGVVDGSLIVIGEDVSIRGSVDGDVAVLGGQLEIDNGGQIGGSCSLMGGELSLSGSPISCDQPFGNWVPASFAGIMGAPAVSGINQVSDLENPADPDSVDGATENSPGFFARSFGMLMAASFAGFVAYLLSSIFPGRLQQVKEVAAGKLVPAGSVGLLTAVASTSFLLLTSPIWILVIIVLSFIFGLGIILALGFFVFLFGLVMLGWTAVGSLLGNRIAGRPLKIHHIGAHEPRIAAIGTGLMTLVVLFLISIAPVVGWLFGTALSAVGLGSVVLTRIGRQPYPQFELNQDVIDIELEPGMDPYKVQSVIETLPPEK